MHYKFLLGLVFLMLVFPGELISQEESYEFESADPQVLFGLGFNQKEATQLTDRIYYAVGFGYTYMVTTPEGNVIIDTSMPFNAPRHKNLLSAVNANPVKYIILTHGHLDHRGGVPVWKTPENQVVAHENFVEFRQYQGRLATFLSRRGNAQFGLSLPYRKASGNYGETIEADILVKDSMVLELGDLTFHVLHTPGETPDHISVWIPELRAAFVGDNFYASFPNMYTLRGTKPRWALEYVESLQKILELAPEVLIPSHGPIIEGKDAIEKAIKQYQEAILYVHDETVKGMNEGKSVQDLMNQIALPDHLNIGSGYGSISWTVRGIYEGYAGWFDGDAKNMYGIKDSDIYDDVVDLIGNNDKIVAKASVLFEQKEYLKSIQMTDLILNSNPDEPAALNVRLKAFERLLESANNANEVGWLRHEIGKIKEQLNH